MRMFTPEKPPPQRHIEIPLSIAFAGIRRFDYEQHVAAVPDFV